MRPRYDAVRRRTISARVTVALLATALIVASCSGSSTTHPRAAIAPVEPSALVNPFMGTGVGGSAVGDINASPAAAVPFGMMQWGPDTVPHRAAGGGYHDGDTALSGLSLTHLSGPGCASYGDVPILPTVGAVTGAPEQTTARFAPSSQHAAPGRYSVALGSVPIGVDLAVTTRTGIARFTFPSTTARERAVQGRRQRRAARPPRTPRSIGDRESRRGRSRRATSATRPAPTRCISTRSSTARSRACRDLEQRPLRTRRRTRAPARTRARPLTFDTTRNRAVTMKVGISFVSVDSARSNLTAENPGWNVDAVARAATQSVERDARPHRGERRHARSTSGPSTPRSITRCCTPTCSATTTVSTPGFDGKLHTATGYTQYANFSSWDTYRSEMQLLALLEPHADRRHGALAPCRLRAERVPAEARVRRLRQRRDER